MPQNQKDLEATAALQASLQQQATKAAHPGAKANLQQKADLLGSALAQENYKPAVGRADKHPSNVPNDKFSGGGAGGGGGGGF